MTETRETSGTAYVPISCALHSEYELAILRHRRLHRVWAEGDTLHDRTVLPLDLKTMERGDPGEGGGGTTSGTAAGEFLVFCAEDGQTRELRLDGVRRMEAAA